MKTIGIKLADGTFYPILKEGTPEKKELNLTTVKDNQTTVQVDLYRSETGTMEDAEYVDTLEIKHLKKHPNGDPDIALDISIDENNELNAELHDPETGRDSSTTVNLVSRTLDQLTDSSDITNAETGSLDDDFDLEASLSNSVQEESFDSDEEINFDPNSLNIDSLVEEQHTVEADDTTIASDSSADDTIAASDDLSFDIPDDTTVASDDAATTEAGTDDSFTSDTSADDTLTMDDLSIPDDFGTEPASETTSEESTESDSSSMTFTDDDFSIPDEEPVTFDEPAASTDSTETTDTTDTSLDFDVPATDDTESFSFDEPATDTLADTSNSDDLFNDTSFDEPAATQMAETSNSAGLDFSDILDEETKEGHAATSDTETIRKKTKVPVLICIICAIICIIAVILIFFIIPSKVNLVKKSAGTQTQVVEKSADENTEEKEEIKHPAKENEIVVAPAQEVVPEKPKAKAPAGKNISYKIKWGDTLWDLAKTYYNNPWKYKKIAKYNGIKNPDHIISGTTIIIPAE